MKIYFIFLVKNDGTMYKICRSLSKNELKRYINYDSYEKLIFN